MDTLNPQQQQAVTAPLGPTLVLAGAGSGKTKVLTHRIAWLIDKGYFSPDQILAVTFTNKAAEEMGERVQKLLTGNPKIAFGTFHSICVRILRQDIKHLSDYTSHFSIFDTDDSLKAFRQILKNLDLDKEYKPTAARAIVSSLKNKGIHLDDYEDPNLSQIAAAYQNLLQEANALDFDDLLILTNRLFEKHPKVLQKYQQKWPYLLVDEYQDTNELQYRLIKFLSAQNHYVFAVGDDAQSIYGFRGANFRNILNFEKDFPEAKTFTLSQNYRSTQNILTAANEVIALSAWQKPKQLWTENDSGDPIQVYTAIDESAEALFVAGEILNLTNQSQTDEPSYEPDPQGLEYEEETPFFDGLYQSFKKTPPVKQSIFLDPKQREQLKDLAILYRTNAQSRILEEALMRYGIPYHLIGSVRFYERREIKDVLSFLRLLLNKRDIVSLERVINLPARGIGPKSLQFVLSNQLSLLRPKARQGWQDFSDKLKSIEKTNSDESLADLLNIILKKFDLKDYYLDGSPEGEDRWDNVQELLSVASKYDHLPWTEAAVELLAEVALYSDIDEIGSGAGVRLMTLHQAKGLEFNTVFLVGLEEGLLPHMRSLESGEDLSEEIRLAYVGFTRAKEKLYLSHAQTRKIYGTSYNFKPSRVLTVVPEELVEVKDWWGN